MTRLQDLNDKISMLFDAGDPFSLVRVGNTEGYFIQNIFNSTRPQSEFYRWLELPAGVYPIDEEYLKGVWYSENISSMKNSDILGFVDVSGQIKSDKSFVETFGPSKETFFGVEDISVLDPGALLNSKKIVNPWTKNLKGKKVLVVSSHAESIKSQWKQLDKVWGERVDDIAPFDLVDVIRSPFHPELDDRQYSDCFSWDQTANYLKSLIDNYDYDVLLVGSASYSPLLADHAKRSGKIGITLCGAIQLYFGVLGSRWTKSQLYSSWNFLYNDYWIYPMEEDLPKNAGLFNRFEKAYW